MRIEPANWWIGSPLTSKTLNRVSSNAYRKGCAASPNWLAAEFRYSWFHRSWAPFHWCPYPSRCYSCPCWAVHCERLANDRKPNRKERLPFAKKRYPIFERCDRVLVSSPKLTCSGRRRMRRPIYRNSLASESLCSKRWPIYSWMGEFLVHISVVKRLIYYWFPYPSIAVWFWQRFSSVVNWWPTMT